MTQQAPVTGNGTASKELKVEENILLVPLTSIYIDAKWNARSGNWQDDQEEKDKPDGGFQGLLESLKISKKNTTPVELRPTQDVEIKKKFPYTLVAGFRRCRCAQLLEWTHVRAIVKEMSDYEARVRNIQEGTAHSNLKTPDLAWAIGDMKTKGGPKLKDEDIAKVLGISQSYVSMLRRVQTDVKPTVTKAWRESGLKVPVEDMLRLTQLKPEDHDAEWQKLAADRDQTTGRKKTESPYMKLKERCHTKGVELGLLAQVKVITLNKKGAWDIAVQELFHVSSQVTGPQLVKCCEALAAGYDEGLVQKLKTDEKDEEEES